MKRLRAAQLEVATCQHAQAYCARRVAETSAAWRAACESKADADDRLSAAQRELAAAEQEAGAS